MFCDDNRFEEGTVVSALTSCFRHRGFELSQVDGYFLSVQPDKGTVLRISRQFLQVI